MVKALNRAKEELDPGEITLLAPRIPSAIAGGLQSPSDSYYRLEVFSVTVSQKLRNVLKRAGRDLIVESVKTFDDEHRELVERFLLSHPVEEGTSSIFRKIPEYLQLGPLGMGLRGKRQGENACCL